MAALALAPAARATDDPKTKKPISQEQPYNPPIAPASDQALKAIRSFRVPKGLKVELFAAEPLLANPVAFCIDEKGVVYVAETFRLHAGVTDTRGHMNWLDDDLACRTVADRVAMYKKYLGSEFATYDVSTNACRRIVDRDGDGRADHATVFADGFNDPAAGLGAGVLAREGDVWFTCIPGLWKLRDTNGDGRADRAHAAARRLRRPRRLSRPRPARPAVRARRQALFQHRRPRLQRDDHRRPASSPCPIPARSSAATRTAPSWRSSPRGFATRRSWRSIEYGNLFTGDNNSDSGDRARWVYVVEGGDSGWRIGYQFMRIAV